MNYGLKDKVALITGAGRGIGREIALALADEGCHIALVDVDENTLNQTASDIKSKDVKALALKADVSNSTEVEKVVDETYKMLGAIDILVNNAGITRDNLIMRMKDEEWDKVIAINLKGTFNFTKAVSRYMLKQRSGKIINIASVIGIGGNIGQANYSASKAGVIALTKSSAKEFATRNINVNAIAPGFIQTAMTEVINEEVKKKMLERIPLQRLGTVRDIADVVLFLASDKSSYITGQVIVVDGGMVM
ncbi:MAG: 3-oxoacyl-[acyl-carrier-protein] reductase [Planctomycetota bacterium]|nr:3-oxoacyl-[acyl-carrier-protein] reductase [Planctomycetota bacterium]MDI6787635.1 3-oxoacyl-[acyl-carrier-protein] reductase [Planctomycetota bacterium]